MEIVSILDWLVFICVLVSHKKISPSTRKAFERTWINIQGMVLDDGTRSAQGWLKGKGEGPSLSYKKDTVLLGGGRHPGRSIGSLSHCTSQEPESEENWNQTIKIQVIHFHQQVY